MAFVETLIHNLAGLPPELAQQKLQEVRQFLLVDLRARHLPGADRRRFVFFLLLFFRRLLVPPQLRRLPPQDGPPRRRRRLGGDGSRLDAVQA